MPKIPTSLPWETRPVPGCKIVAIAQKGMMFPHAEVRTPAEAYGDLTDLEYANAELIVKAVNYHDLMLNVLRRLEDYGMLEVEGTECCDDFVELKRTATQLLKDLPATSLGG